jgi:hypothetical protein
MKLERTVMTAFLVTWGMLATAPAEAQGLGGSRPRALTVPQRVTHPLDKGSGRRVSGLPLVVRPCEPGPRFGPQLPHGACISIYPDPPVSREKSTGVVIRPEEDAFPTSRAHVSRSSHGQF